MSPRWMTRLPPGPPPGRFTIQTSSFCYGKCSEFRLDVDARGHVEYDGVRNVSRIGRFASDDGAELFLALERAAALARPDSLTYDCGGFDGHWVDVAVDHQTGRQVWHTAMLWCGAYALFAKEVYRLLPTLALTPTTRPHRFATERAGDRWGMPPF